MDKIFAVSVKNILPCKNTKDFESTLCSQYIVRLSSFNVTGTDFDILATVNVLASNNLELYVNSNEFLTNGLQLRFLMELIPIDFS